MAPANRVGFWSLFVAVLLLPVGSASAGPAQDVSARVPADFTEGIWIRKYPGNFACFKLETPGGLRVVTDPCAMDETISVDVVTESHQHADHVDTSQLTGAFTVLRKPGEYRVKGIRITGIPGKHNQGDAGVTNTVFVFEIGGLRIAHFASQGAPLGEKALSKLGTQVEHAPARGIVVTRSDLERSELPRVVDMDSP